MRRQPERERPPEVLIPRDAARRQEVEVLAGELRAAACGDGLGVGRPDGDTVRYDDHLDRLRPRLRQEVDDVRDVRVRQVVGRRRVAEAPGGARAVEEHPDGVVTTAREAGQGLVRGGCVVGSDVECAVLGRGLSGRDAEARVVRPTRDEGRAASPVVELARAGRKASPDQVDVRRRRRGRWRRRRLGRCRRGRRWRRGRLGPRPLRTGRGHLAGDAKRARADAPRLSPRGAGEAVGPPLREARAQRGRFPRFHERAAAARDRERAGSLAGVSHPEDRGAGAGPLR